MKRKDVLENIKPVLDQHNVLVVCNIGHPSQELYALGDRQEYFYMLGSMGLASSIGLGLSRTTPKTVVSIDGDGSVLMNLGTLATIAHQAPSNYKLIIIDNQSYGSTGHQPTYTRKSTSLADIAKGAGCKNVCTCEAADAPEQVKKLVEKSCAGILIIKTEAGAEPLVPIPLDPGYIKQRFMDCVGGVTNES